MPVIEPTQTYLHLDDDGTARTVPVGADFWKTISQRTDLHGGRLLCAFASAGFDHWEMHPAGEELIVPLSGAFVLIVEGGEETPLAPGQVGVVPKGAWHRLAASQPGQAIFITPGEGTRHKPLQANQSEAPVAHSR